MAAGFAAVWVAKADPEDLVVRVGQGAREDRVPRSAGVPMLDPAAPPGRRAPRETPEPTATLRTYVCCEVLMEISHLWRSARGLCGYAALWMCIGAAVAQEPGPSAKARTYPFESATTTPVRLTLTGQTRVAHTLVQVDVASSAHGCFGPEHGPVEDVRAVVEDGAGFPLEPPLAGYDRKSRCWTLTIRSQPKLCSGSESICARYPSLAVHPQYRVHQRPLVLAFSGGQPYNNECRYPVIQVQGPPACEAEVELFDVTRFPVRVETPYLSGLLQLSAGTPGKRCVQFQGYGRLPAREVPNPFRATYDCPIPGLTQQVEFPAIPWVVQ